MNDDPMAQIPSFNRVSIPAVLVSEGQDPHSATAAAGIFDPIVVPVVMGNEIDLGEGILGDGVTLNLTAVLETVSDGNADHAPASPSSVPARSTTPDTQPSRPVTAVMPASYGMQPMAPIRRSS